MKPFSCKYKRSRSASQVPFYIFLGVENKGCSVLACQPKLIGSFVHARNSMIDLDPVDQESGHVNVIICSFGNHYLLPR